MQIKIHARQNKWLYGAEVQSCDVPSASMVTYDHIMAKVMFVRDEEGGLLSRTL